MAHYMWSHQQLFGHLFNFLLLAHFLHSCALFTLSSFSFFFASFSKLSFFQCIRHHLQLFLCIILFCILMFYCIWGIVFWVVVQLPYHYFMFAMFWFLFTIAIINLVFGNWTLLSFCIVHFILAFVCDWISTPTITLCSFYSWLLQNLCSFYYFSCCVWFLLFVVQNDDVTDFKILFQGVPFFITFCSCKCFKYVIFFLHFFSLLLVFPCLCLYFFSSYIIIVVIMVENLYWCICWF